MEGLGGVGKMSERVIGKQRDHAGRSMRPRNERVGGHLELRTDLAIRALGEQGCGHEKLDEKWSDEQPAKTAMEGMHKTP